MENSPSVYNRGNHDLRLFDAIDYAVAVSLKLTEACVIELRNLASLLRKLREAAAQMNDSSNHGFGVGR